MPRPLRVASCLAACAACGRIGFDANDALPITRCAWTQPNVAQGVLEPSLDQPGFVDGVWLAQDGLDLVFSDDPGTGRQLFSAHRDTTAIPFGARVPISDFGNNVSQAAFSADLLDVVVFHDSDLFEAQRASVGDPWPPAVAISALANPRQNQFPWLSPDGNTLWFNRAGSVVTDQQIFVTTRPRRGDSWSPPTLVPELVDPTYESFHPTLDGAQHTILFASRRQPALIQVFYATRASLSAPWSSPQPIALRADPLNQALPSLSSDGCSIAFGSPRGMVDGQWHVWTTTAMP